MDIPVGRASEEKGLREARLIALPSTQVLPNSLGGDAGREVKIQLFILRVLMKPVSYNPDSREKSVKDSHHCSSNSLNLMELTLSNLTNPRSTLKVERTWRMESLCVFSL